MKKILALFLSLTLALALALPAFANATVNINGVALSGVVRQEGKTLSFTEYDASGKASVVEKDVTIYYFPATGGKITVNAEGDKLPGYLLYTLEDGAYLPTDGGPVDWSWDVVKEDWFQTGMLFGVEAEGVKDVYYTFDETSTTPVFTDVAEGAWYAEAVKWAVEKEITTGTTDTTFSPNSTCTTAQILTFLWRAKGSPAPTAENPFTDVAEDAWYADAAIWAYENKLVSGETFNGSAPCTRSATVTYLWTLAGKPTAEKTAFTDVAEDAAYAEAVAWAVKENITSGTSETTFSPDSTCTRGQIVTFLFRDLAE